MAATTGMSMEKLLALPAVMDIVQAGEVFGLGRTKSYELAQAGEFPCTVLRVGQRYKVARPHIFRAIGLEVPVPQDVAEDAETRKAS